MATAHRQVAPIGFLLVEKFFVTCFGSGEYALRLFPLLSFIGAVYAVDIDNVQLKLTAAVAADPSPSLLDGTWTVVVSQ